MHMRSTLTTEKITKEAVGTDMVGEYKTMFCIELVL